MSNETSDKRVSLREACEHAEAMLRDGGTFPIKGQTWRLLHDALEEAPSARGESAERAEALEEALQVCLAASFQYRKDADDMQLRNVPMPQVNQLRAMASGIEIIYERIRALKKSQYVK